MQRTRVLVVDDSSVVRRMLTGILSEDPELEVVGTASTGEEALAKLGTCNPDVVTLDIEMPGLSGLDTLVELRKQSPRLSIIMFSSLTQRAAATTLEALARGATDYVTKPSNAGSREAAMEQVRSQLVPKIKGLARPMATSRASRAIIAPMPVRKRPVAASTTSSPQILVIASSTGGPNALATVLAGMRGTRTPIAIVQHMPPVFTRILAERLTAASGLDVREGVTGEAVQPGRVYIAPGDFHMKLVREDRTVRVVLEQGPPENSCRPAADVLFRSAAEAYRAATLGVVLTGMGQDGLRGCEAIRDVGGRIVAQDQATSVVWGMPGAVVNANLADEVAPVEGIAPTLHTMLQKAEHRVEAAHGR